MGEKHSAVGYLFREGAFLPAQETKPVRNEFGLDLFQHRGSVYEGKTGLQFCSLQQAEDLAGFVEKHGGIEKVQKLIADSLERTGLSPRYTRPDEKKKDIFPPKEKDENRVFAKDLMGNKHYYYRFYNENGIELYTMEKKREFFQTVYIPCDGFMVGIDQRHRLEAVLKWLPIFVLWRLSVRFPISGMTGNGVHLTGFSGFLGFHGILHESYVIVAIGIIGLILLITDFIRIKKNNR